MMGPAGSGELLDYAQRMANAGVIRNTSDWPRETPEQRELRAEMQGASYQPELVLLAAKVATLAPGLREAFDGYRARFDALVAVEGVRGS